ncbi:signal transduction histidine kinase [Streptomyces sp. Amel2xB2]|uniref:sensor histidine kinase n=1 Tax=Streptomyces sp. Amel2xB2 TaxID=1305829 RepID=UPI000DC00797|nr:ATP-binding protein [Streptomyces sp. Amel2xB2]RAJ69008.1 signal transduction histidine kinase [Streptomyces sp. Amel2xB2]
MPELPSRAAQTERGNNRPPHAPGHYPGNAPLPVAAGPNGASAQATSAAGTVPAVTGGDGAHGAYGTNGGSGGGGSRRRHGRTAAPQSQGDAVHRRRLVRLAVTPAFVVAVAAAAVVAYVMSAEGGDAASSSSTSTGDGPVLWSVLGAALLLVCGVIAVAAHSAGAQARAAVERQRVLRRAVARGQSDLRMLLNSLEQGERPRLRPLPAEDEPGPDADAFAHLTHELAHAQHAAETAVTDTVAFLRSSTSGSEEKVEVFVNLARRLQSLVHREIELLDELENQVEDPDLLKGLFHVDHLATRIRRHAENLAVLGGAVSRRQWSRPVSMTEVLRSSIAEVEHYPRVKLVPPIEGTLHGHAVADVIHLLAELVENATVFSAPQTQVLLRAQHVTAGLAIEVEDRGLGMPAPEQDRMNAVLSDPERIDVGELLRDGRIGLFVVSALAQRHGIVVQLQSNIYGGIQAVLVLPREVLGEEPGTGEQSGAEGGAATGAAAHGGTDGAAAAAGRERGVRAQGVHEPGVRELGAREPGVPAETVRARGPQAGQPQPQAHPQPQPQGPHAQQQPLPQQRPEPDAPSPLAGTGPQPQPGVHARIWPEPQPPAEGGSEARPHERHRSPSQPQPQPQSQPEPQLWPEPQPLPKRSGRGGDGSAAGGDVTDAGAGAGTGAVNGDRPQLPRRRRQEHLAPELREAPPARTGRTAEADWDMATQGHDPGLMAAFQRGATLAGQSRLDAAATGPEHGTDSGNGIDPGNGTGIGSGPGVGSGTPGAENGTAHGPRSDVPRTDVPRHAD